MKCCLLTARYCMILRHTELLSQCTSHFVSSNIRYVCFKSTTTPKSISLRSHLLFEQNVEIYKSDISDSLLKITLCLRVSSPLCLWRTPSPRNRKKNCGCVFLNYFILNVFICLSLSHSKEFMGTHRPLYQVQVLGWTHIYTHCSQQCLFCCGTNSARCWTRSSESLYHIDRIVSHSCCRFIGCTSIITSLNYIPKEL